MPEHPILSALTNVALAGHPVAKILIGAGAPKLAAAIGKKSPAVGVVINKIAEAVAPAAVGSPPAVVADAIVAAHTANPAVVESAAQALENDPAMVAYLTATAAGQADLFAREDARESFFSWGWRPALSWLLIVMIVWNWFLLPTINSLFHLAIASTGDIIALSGIWLTIYGGGHTLKSIMGK